MNEDHLLDTLTDRDVLALTIFGEARGESLSGMGAVGEVIRNRVRSNYRGETFKAVCLKPLQFSCWNASDPNRKILLALAEQLIRGETPPSATFVECAWVADGVIGKALRSRLPKTTRHYAVTDSWKDGRISWDRECEFVPVATISNHVFFSNVP